MSDIRSQQKYVVILSASEGSRMVTQVVLFTGFFTAARFRMTDVFKRTARFSGFRPRPTRATARVAPTAVFRVIRFFRLPPMSHTGRHTGRPLRLCFGMPVGAALCGRPFFRVPTMSNTGQGFPGRKKAPFRVLFHRVIFSLRRSGFCCRSRRRLFSFRSRSRSHSRNRSPCRSCCGWSS